MKKFVLVFVLVGLMAAPALADIVRTISPTSAVAVGSGSTRHGVPIYADLMTSGYYANHGSGSTYPLPVSDDIHAISGGTITGFDIGYYNPGAGPTFNLQVSFFANDAVDSSTPWPPGPAGSIASYMVTGLPAAGAWIVHVDGVSVPVGPDFWFEADYGGLNPGSGDVNVGPLLTFNSGGTVGYSHDLYGQTGSQWSFGGPPFWADFVLAFYTPEPTTIGLLALCGLVILRRR